MSRRCWLFVVFALVAAPALAQHGQGHECTPAGVWYGGSVVAYQMTIVPAGPAGEYMVTAQGMYKNSVINTIYSGYLKKNGRVYEGSLMQLTTNDPAFLGNPALIGKMPDVVAGWIKVEMVDCKTLSNTIPFFGSYFGAGMWEPGLAGATFPVDGKKPLIDPPDIDLLDVLAGGQPIVETYRRLPASVNPVLLHK